MTLTEMALKNACEQLAAARAETAQLSAQLLALRTETFMLGTKINEQADRDRLH